MTRTLRRSGIVVAIVVTLAIGFAAHATLRPMATHDARAAGTRRGRWLRAPVGSAGVPGPALQSHTRGIYLLFDYDLSRSYYLDLNGDAAGDTGNREVFPADVWLSDPAARRLRWVGTAVVTDDYLPAERSNTGTDIAQLIDLAIFGEGQIRAGGFWNVRDGSRPSVDPDGDPLIPVLGVTGTRFLRNFRTGQLRFVARVAAPDGFARELYFLER